MARNIKVEELPLFQALHFPVTSSGSNLLSRSEDIALKFEAVTLMTQARLARALYTQAGVALWDRQTLDSVLYEHGTAHCGENIYAGLLLLRLRDKGWIETCPNAQVR